MCLDVIAQRSEAIHTFLLWRDGLLRFARNDGAARWIESRSLSSVAYSRDPLARNDGLPAEITITTIGGLCL